MVDTNNNAPAVGVHTPMYLRHPMHLDACPLCGVPTKTSIFTFPTAKTWCAAGAFFLVFWPLCWVPLVMDSCKKTEHTCSVCHNKIGAVDAFQDCCVTRAS